MNLVEIETDLIGSILFFPIKLNLKDLYYFPVLFYNKKPTHIELVVLPRNNMFNEFYDTPSVLKAGTVIGGGIDFDKMQRSLGGL